MPCSLSGLLFMSFPRIVCTNTLGACVTQSTQTYSPMHLRHMFRFFIFFLLLLLWSLLSVFYPALCSQTKPVFTRDRCTGSPLPAFWMPCSFFPHLSFFPSTPPSSLIPRSQFCRSVKPVQGPQQWLSVFCLYSPWSLKKLFHPSYLSPCACLSTSNLVGT